MYVFGGWAIEQDPATPKWWVSVNGDPVGYYPDSIFPPLSFTNASIINWGGAVLNRRNGGRHTSTEMGSGVYARHGVGESAFVERCEISEDRSRGSTDFHWPINFSPHMSHPNCYTAVQAMRVVKGKRGMWAFFGGAGGAGCDVASKARL
ncbi:hypothetical protein QJS04_geneDACA002515 [Acorus gramineus]|uniref:Neprosin PEP catalytic domain-containing protein n=1 Tax=Acorus gramineus TaxID=55184 RepID=A0AAV9AQ78_ACOGR|nr:hypothetical protein QJS04_geneDACA002515 [Acorus gramineus]